MRAPAVAQAPWSSAAATAEGRRCSAGDASSASTSAECSQECSRGLVSIVTLRNRRILQLATYHGRDLDELFEVPRFCRPNSSISKSYDRGVFLALLGLEKTWKARIERWPGSAFS